MTRISSSWLCSYNSNVNYYTVRPKVTVDQIKNKVVY